VQKLNATGRVQVGFGVLLGGARGGGGGGWREGPRKLKSYIARCSKLQALCSVLGGTVGKVQVVLFFWGRGKGVPVEKQAAGGKGRGVCVCGGGGQEGVRCMRVSLARGGGEGGGRPVCSVWLSGFRGRAGQSSEWLVNSSVLCSSTYRACQQAGITLAASDSTKVNGAALMKQRMHMGLQVNRLRLDGIQSAP